MEGQRLAHFYYYVISFPPPLKWQEALRSHADTLYLCFYCLIDATVDWFRVVLFPPSMSTLNWCPWREARKRFDDIPQQVRWFVLRQRRGGACAAVLGTIKKWCQIIRSVNVCAGARLEMCGTRLEISSMNRQRFNQGAGENDLLAITRVSRGSYTPADHPDCC